MRLALLTSEGEPRPNGLAPHVERLGRELAQRGADVTILVGLVLSPRQLERLRALAGTVDVVDVHGTSSLPVLAAARLGFERVVFTIHGPVEPLLAWSHGWATRAAVTVAAQIVCGSEPSRRQLCERFPAAARRVRTLPLGIDVSAIESAHPLPGTDRIVLISGRLERGALFERAIAAMAVLEPGFRLVVLGEGPDARWLKAYAADLRVGGRVMFAGAVSEDERYRWLRTASVVLAHLDTDAGGRQLSEALAARAGIVATDTDVHRELVASLEDGRIELVPIVGSPLEVAEAIRGAARRRQSTLREPLPDWLPSWERTADAAWDIYQRLTTRQRDSRRAKAPEPAGRELGPAHTDPPGVTIVR